MIHYFLIHNGFLTVFIQCYLQEAARAKQQEALATLKLKSTHQLLSTDEMKRAHGSDDNNMEDRDVDDGDNAQGVETNADGRSSLRRGTADAPPFDDLRLVGKILISPAPVYHAGAGGNRVDVTVETWLTDVYRCSEWWIELPNVED